MLNEYRTTYALLSETVHSTVHSLEADLVINDNNNEIEAINAYEQKLGNMFTLLMTTANYMIISLNKVLIIDPNIENQASLQKLSHRMQAEWQTTVVAVPHR